MKRTYLHVRPIIIKYSVVIDISGIEVFFSVPVSNLAEMFGKYHAPSGLQARTLFSCGSETVFCHVKVN